MQNSELIACRDCDLLQTRVALPPRGAAVCSRCGAVLYRERGDSLPHALAYILAAGIAFALANAFPVFSLSVTGARSSTTLWHAVNAMWAEGMLALSIFVCYAALVSPALFLAVTAYALARLLFGGDLGNTAFLLRLLHAVRPWAMVEVFMLGVLVSVIKIAGYATVEPGIGLWAFAATVVLQALAMSVLEPEDLWRRFADHDRGRSAPEAA